MTVKGVSILKRAQKIHFIGIGGVGMSGLAAVLHDLGRETTGSDASHSLYTERLESMGITVYLGHKAGQGEGADAFVVSTAIRKDNPELVWAKENDVPILHRSDVMAYICNSRRGIAIAGAHGKTTTTGMISKIFMENQMEPTILVGAAIPELGGNAFFGRGVHAITEADESDGSFLKLHPALAMITNIEDDHLDHYGSFGKLHDSFGTFLEGIQPGGWAILCSDCESTMALIPRVSGKRVVRYGFLPDDEAKAENVTFHANGSQFTLVWQGKVLGEIILPLPGRHNILNALGAAAVSLLEGIPYSGIAKALATFHGAHRRFQRHGEVAGIQVIDDYAHHPTELKATLAAARQIHPAGRIVAIFQPHRYSRTKQLIEEFSSAFDDADVLLLTDIYSAGEEPIDGIDGEYLQRKVNDCTGIQPIYIPKWQEIAEKSEPLLREGDLVLTLGAGSINQVAPQILEKLQSRNK